MDIMDDAITAFNKIPRSQLIDTAEGLPIKLNHSLVSSVESDKVTIKTKVTLLEDVVLRKGINNLYLKGKLRDEVKVSEVKVIPDIFIDGDNVTLLRKNNLCISILIEETPKQEVLLKAGKPSFWIIADRFITDYESEEKFRNDSNNDSV